MRTRSPSIAMRGMTATSARHSRSWEGSIVDHATRMTRYTAANAASFAALRRVQSAQAANAQKAAASTILNHAAGKVENQMASVPQAMKPTRSRDQSAASSQRRGFLSHEARRRVGSSVGIAREYCRAGLQYNPREPGA